METIKSEVMLLAPVEKVWDSFSDPKHVIKWFFVIQSQRCESAVNELKEGGTFRYVMSTKNQGSGYDFTGTIKTFVPREHIVLVLTDGREVDFKFNAIDKDTTKFSMVFEPETKNTHQTQKRFWDVVLSNFERYVENLK